MDISSQISIAVYCAHAENWKMLLARIHLFLRTFIKKIDERRSSSDAGRLSIV